MNKITEVKSKGFRAKKVDKKQKSLKNVPYINKRILI